EISHASSRSSCTMTSIGRDFGAATSCGSRTKQWSRLEEAPMGGSGGGSSYRMTQREVEQLRTEAQERLERSRLDAEVNSYLQAELSRINDRDVELVEERLSQVEGAIEAQ